MTSRVVKIGGRVLEEPDWLARFSASIARAAPGMIVVHGGGPAVDGLCDLLGITVERVNGLRVTSRETLDVAGMVLSGRLNKRLVRALSGAGVDALGVSGEDGGLLVAEPVASGVLGRVGEKIRVRVDLLRGLLGLGVVPVVSPISRGTDGEALNVNADDAAVAIAAALRSEELVFLTDVAAVSDGVRDLTQLSAGEARVLVETGVASGGMAVKVTAGLRALDAGVRSVRIGPVEALADPATGTRLDRQTVVFESESGVAV